MSYDRLFPALLECFGIILCGYVAGRADIITSTQAKGLGNFVSKFALPALLFKNMVVLDFGNVIWPFLWSILIAKVCVFFMVCVLTLIVASPDSRFSKAGIFSIFATQSNDFALGYPIVEALYKRSHPQYLQYIYLVAPVSLIILNPIGFAFCEIQKWKNQETHQQSKYLVVGCVILQVLKNPIVFMVVIGLIAHLILQHNIPAFMVEFVDCLADSFGGAALFYLGLSMVGQMRKISRTTFVILILLLTAKLLLMPLISKNMVDLLDNSNISAMNHSSLSNYAFLYGVFPTAPSVAIYAVYYNVEIEVVTSGMVISTFLSAPIMYVSAWLLSVRQMDPKLVISSLQSVTFNISILSLVLLVWTFAVVTLTKKIKRLPYMLTVNLFLSQFMTCIGMILWNFVVSENNFLWQVLTFTLLWTSLYSTYIWPAIIALALVLMKRYGDLKVSPGVLVLTAWGIPAVVTAVLLFSGEKISDTVDSSFIYGKPQIICTSVVAALSILLGGGSLVCLSRESGTLQQNIGEGTSVQAFVDPEIEPVIQTKLDPANPSEEVNRGHCEKNCTSRDCLLVHMENLPEAADGQVARHELLCLILIVSLLANLSSCLWLLFYHIPGKLYLELQFFCAVANYGQGFLSFAVFGLDKQLMLMLFNKRFGRKDFDIKIKVPIMAPKGRWANKALKKKWPCKTPIGTGREESPVKVEKISSPEKKDPGQVVPAVEFVQEETKVLIHYLPHVPDLPQTKRDPIPSGSETLPKRKDMKRKKRVKK